ncbi:MAG: hypothetical protein ACREQ9_06065 [Candidatus Binatia bacterium]
MAVRIGANPFPADAGEGRGASRHTSRRHRLFLEIGAPLRAEEVAKELAG